MRWLLLPLVLTACEPPASQPAAEPPRQAAAPAATGKLDRSHAGEAAPAAAFQNPDGDAVSLADFQGTPVLVNLWATWCAPCVAELPTLDALAAREEGKLEVLALSQDTTGRERVEAFVAERGLTMLEPYIDPEMALMLGLKVDTLPTTILYDARGREVWRITGAADWMGTRAAALLGEASPAAAR